jgi:hypothetical protein
MRRHAESPNRKYADELGLIRLQGNLTVGEARALASCREYRTVCEPFYAGIKAAHPGIHATYPVTEHIYSIVSNVAAILRYFPGAFVGGVHSYGKAAD